MKESDFQFLGYRVSKIVFEVTDDYNPRLRDFSQNINMERRFLEEDKRFVEVVLNISLEDKDNREKYWIEKMKGKCVNKQIPQNINAQTSQEYHKEYRQKNYEKLRQKDKEYYEANKPYLLERNRRYKRRIGKARIYEMWKNYYSRKKDWINRRVKCDCGAEMNHSCLSRHKRSKKHQEKMRELGIDKENIIVIDELPIEPLDINIPNIINNIELE